MNSTNGQITTLELLYMATSQNSYVFLQESLVRCLLEWAEKSFSNCVHFDWFLLEITEC